ncbi:hypothetical protein [Desulforegula conservatrix]|uniref:hypothetical protein n=1 Tax=Desulforegula conservatrix TaxID=153026 RepID=UPI0004084E91|nr:hypothetical protein [Desulforegula conservatrix]
MKIKKNSLISNEYFRDWFELYFLVMDEIVSAPIKFNTFLHAYSNLTNLHLSELTRLQRQTSPIDFDAEYYRATGAKFNDFFVTSLLKKALIKNKGFSDNAILVDNTSFIGMLSYASVLKEFKIKIDHGDLLSIFEYLQILLKCPVDDLHNSITQDKYIKPLVVICSNDDLEKKALSVLISFAENMPNAKFSVEKLAAKNLLFIGSFHKIDAFCVLKISFGNKLFFDEVCGVTGYRPNVSVLKERITLDDIHSYLSLPNDPDHKSYGFSQLKNHSKPPVESFFMALERFKSLILTGYFEKLDSVSRYVSDMFMGLILDQSDMLKEFSEDIFIYHMKEVISIINGFPEDNHDFAHKLISLEYLNNCLIQILLYMRPYKNPLEQLMVMLTKKYEGSFSDNSYSLYYMPNGMRGLCACLEAAIDHYKTLRIGYFNDLYYETQQMVRAFSDSKQLVNLTKGKYPTVLPNVLFYDFKPNNARVSEIETLRLVDLLDYCDPVNSTIVLDVTLSYISEPELTDFIKLCSSRIVNGSINLIILQSLSKYFQCGMDKFLGAYILNLYSGNNYSLFRRKLAKYSDSGLISDSSLQYFCHIFKYSHDHHYQYIRDIQDNGQFLYSRIGPENIYPDAVLSENVISISKLHDSHLYLGLSTNDFAQKYFPTKRVEFNTLIFEYLNKKFCSRNLQIAVRNSLGFASCVINNVHTAIRFVVGLESKELMEEYANIINDICCELNIIKTGLVNLKQSEKTLTSDNKYQYFELEVLKLA